MKAVLASRGEGTYALSGTLDFSSVADLWRTSRRIFAQQWPQRIDLREVVYSDSSGIALLVAWLRQVRQRNGHLELIHIPPQMQAIIRVTAMDSLFALHKLDEQTERETPRETGTP